MKIESKLDMSSSNPALNTVSNNGLDLYFETISAFDSEVLSLNEISKKESDSKGITAYLVDMIIRIAQTLTGSYGSKMSSHQMNMALDRIFSQADDWKCSESRNGNGLPDFRSKSLENTRYVVSSSCHDLPESGSVFQRGGSLSVPKVLLDICNAYPVGDVRALLPVAQGNDLGCFGPRGHFTLFDVKIENGKIISAELIDSKGGLIDHFYNGKEKLKDLILGSDGLGCNGLEGKVAKEFSVVTTYLGHQGLLNGNDCGRHVVYAADTIVEKDSLKNASSNEARQFFKDNALV
ncbi:hypothetical protein [Chitinimonas sp. BJB300]|uniref:hypothetical protein n=1 Tax=Chitinimonas sp. BJB300 TaxID=1559339 RepID=UPI000C0D1FCF|nr:hypothetical protein [Chitinimonas sp. BJB300]PHV13242.1 hypothetical protein CSQ89_01630 [Chitinimonas sp. BJB300]TSJ89634.1 hypothetical protein FG002_005260 [Chitinimonas sp. BJB300]